MDDHDFFFEIEYYNHRVCTPSWEIAHSRTSFVDLTYIVNGSAFYTVDGEEFVVKAGDLICIPNGCERSAVSDNDSLMECYAMNGAPCRLDGTPCELPFPLVHHIDMHADIISLFGELGSEWLQRKPGYRIKVRGLALLIIHRYFELIVFGSNHELVDRRVKKAIQYIMNHFAEPLTVQDAAAHVKLNPGYFGRIFQEHTGLSFRQYLTFIRLNQAEDLLRSGEHNVNESAFQCGFKDIFYFSKVFKKHKGVAPSSLLQATPDERSEA
ncbi:MAG: AraC family transcriptional regulator [Clostridiales bacterium]|jgi:AraC-like DNA-binding protein|nr:AraC family transcriptional regulator [Clostridiales bacterium]